MIEDQLAERLFRAENPAPSPLLPWAKYTELGDLWPSEQEKYRKQARELINAGIVL